jgi:hypothetical protein
MTYGRGDEVMTTPATDGGWIKGKSKRGRIMKAARTVYCFIRVGVYCTVLAGDVVGTYA